MGVLSITLPFCLFNFQLTLPRSKDFSTSSKTSKNVLDRICKIEDSQGIASMPQNSMSTHPPNKKLPNPTQDLNNYFDTSDSEDCESVGSNSPKYEYANEINKNQKNDRIEKRGPKSLVRDKNISIRENSSTTHVGNKNMQKEITRTKGPEENLGPKSTPISKNTSSIVTPCKPVLSMCNIANDVKSKKHPWVGGVENGVHNHNQGTLKKVSATHNANYSSTTIRSPPTMQNNETKKCNDQNTMKLDDYITFDEGGGGGPLNTMKKPNMYNHKKNTNHRTQDQNGEDQESFDEGGGGGYGSSNPVTSRRKHRRHRKHARYGIRSSRESQGSNWSTGSSGSNRSGRWRSGSLWGSWSGSQENRRNRGVGRGHRRNSRRGSHQSSRKSSQSSHSSTRSWMDNHGLSILSDTKSYPAKWRCFGRRPPAIHEFRPMGETRVKNVRPAGKPGYGGRMADEKLGCQGPGASDAWDACYGLAKPITDQWSTPAAYGKNVQVGDIDPYFSPSRGDLVIINPAQSFYQAMKSGFVMTYSGQDYSFGVGDLIVHLGRFMPNGDYIPFGNLELYMHTQTREMRLLGFQPPLLVDFNYHNLDYESPGKHLAVGTFLNESFFPRRGDIIIRGGTWAQNYPNIHRKHHSAVKYWRPRMEFLQNDMLLRPYVDIGSRKDPAGENFYWGVAELYTYSGKGLAWAYWGRDHHVYDTPPLCKQEHGIINQKDGIAQNGDSLYGGGYSPHGSHGHQQGHQATHGHHREHTISSRHHRQRHCPHRTSPCT